MQNEKNTTEAVHMHDDGSYVVRKTKKSSILAFIICVLIAFVIWAYAKATDNMQEEKILTSETSTVCSCADVGMSEI